MWKVEFAKVNSKIFVICESFSCKCSPRYDKRKEDNFCEKELNNYIRVVRPLYELQYQRHWKLSVFEQIYFLRNTWPRVIKVSGAKKAEGFCQAIVTLYEVQCPVSSGNLAFLTNLHVFYKEHLYKELKNKEFLSN